MVQDEREIEVDVGYGTEGQFNAKVSTKRFESAIKTHLSPLIQGVLQQLLTETALKPGETITLVPVGYFTANTFFIYMLQNIWKSVVVSPMVPLFAFSDRCLRICVVNAIRLSLQIAKQR